MEKMVEREKLIRAMEYCTGDIVPVDENDECLGDVCPFKEGGYESGDCQENMIRAALALLKEQEPRVMTLEEVIHSKDWVWYQWKNTHYGWAIAVNCDGKWIEWEDSTTDQLCKYGEKWRCWTSRPSPEQMRDTKWEESDV